MPDKLLVQPLLSGRPICTRCDGNYPAETIHDRDNSPAEYHCGCGNYAVVGKPARWLFMVPKKAEEKPDIGIPASVKPDSSGSSPLQVGESLKPKKEKPVKKKCSHPGCEKDVWVKGLCHKHYKEEHGEYVPRYKGNGVVVPKKEARVTLKPEAIQKAVDEGRISQEKGARLLNETTGQVMQQEAVPLFHIFLDHELLEALTEAAKKEYRTPELHAAYLIDKGLRGKHD